MLVLLSLLSCGPKTTPTPTPQGPVTLQIAAINDWHGALYEQPVGQDEDTRWGGLPWLVGTMTALRAAHPDLIVLDGGDVFQGTWPVNASNGAGAVSAFNLLGVDAAAVGNHEFDYGGNETHPLRGHLMDGGRNAEFAWLAANIEDGGETWQPDGFAPTAMIQRSGVQIGVIGLSTMETPQTTLTKNVADLSFSDPVAAVAREAPRLRAQGADVIAVVGHLTGACRPPNYTTPPPGDRCMPDGEIGRLLTELPPGTIDVMVVGHAHTLLAQRIDDTFVLESRDKGKMIGRLALVVTEAGVDADASQILPHVLITHPPTEPGCDGGTFDATPQEIGGMTVTPSEPALSLIAQLEQEAGSLCDEIGCAAEVMTRSYDVENPVGNFVADAMLGAFPEADLAIQNPGGLRANLPSGTLRRENIQQLMPFNNTLYLVEMTGAQVERLFEIGTSGAHGLLQVSAGTSYRYFPYEKDVVDTNGDGEAEEWEKDRLCSVDIDGGPLSPDDTYRVVTTDFLYGGGDHLGPAFEGATLVERGPLLRDVLIEAVEARPAGECLQTDALVRADQPRITADRCR
ncbi:MAG: bifunctional UDP-sugar hydrolase/5'-nucleotidase [Myxococcota bacterium]